MRIRPIRAPRYTGGASAARPGARVEPGARRMQVTVVIPTRDRWELLARAVRSVLTQRRADAEIVVVDDGSARQPADEGDLANPRVRLIRNEHPVGVAAARNAGTRLARTPWIAWLDDDDLWAPDRLSSMLEAARSRDAEFAYSSALIVDDEYRVLRLDPAPHPQTLLSRLRRYNAIPGGGSNMLVRESALERSELFDEDFSFAADWELWLRIASSARGVALEEPLLAYRMRAGGWALSGDAAIGGDLKRLQRKHPSANVRPSPDRMIAQQLWWTGQRASAARRFARVAWRERDRWSVFYAAGSAFTPTAARRLRLVRPAPPTPHWLRAAQRSRLSPRT